MENTDILVGLFCAVFFIFIVVPCGIGNIFRQASYRDALVISCWLVAVVLIASTVVFGVIFSICYLTGWYVDMPKLVSMVEWLNSINLPPPPSAL